MAVEPMVPGAADPAVSDAGAETPLKAVLGLVPFRRFLVAQFLSALVNGTLRFSLVWLALDLTDWEAAPALVGLALGTAGLFVAIPAGAWSDRVDRRMLFIRASALTALVLAAGTALAAFDVLTLGGVAVLAAVLGALLSSVSPTVQAMVPSLVPPGRLMNGVALQMIAMNVATMLGAVVGGATIQVFGNAGGLGSLAVFELLAVWLMSRVEMAPRAEPPPRRHLVTEIREGMSWALRREPTRSLLGIMVVIGFMWGAVTIALPDIAKNELGQGAFVSSALFAPMGLGMIVSSTALAGRDALARRGRLLAFVFSFTAGPVIVLVGLSPSYWLTLALMGVWGTGGGIVMTLQRTMLQEQIPDELMGRVMGLNTIGLLGSFPLAAVSVGVLGGFVGPGSTLAVLGAVTMTAALLLTMRPAIRGA